MKSVPLYLVLFLVFSCTEQAPDKDVFDQPIVEKDKKEKDLNFNERVKREVEAKLDISPSEKYTLKIDYAYLNADDKKDAVITVNRLAFAMDEATKSVNPNKRVELGYMGNYNHFFYYDGKLDKISVPMVVPSSTKTPLKVVFENIQSEVYQDITIEYRIRNSAFKNYYLLEYGALQLMFQWKLFDQVGLDNYEANYIEFTSGSISPAKDILIYKGEIQGYSKNIPDVYSYSPHITKTKELLYHFFYDPKTRKYMTRQN